MDAGPLSPDDLQKFNELFSRAEDILKLSEGLADALPIPPLNQMRYATRHLLDASTTQDAEKRERALTEAFIHLERSCCDAFDVILSSEPQRFHAFEKRYEAIEVSSVIPDYIEIRTLFIDSQDLVDGIKQRVSEKDPGARRADVYANNELLELAKKFRTAGRKLRHAEPELDKKLHAHKEEVNRYLEQLHQTKASTTFGKWGAIAAAVAALLTGAGVYIAMKPAVPAASASTSQESSAPLQPVNPSIGK